MILLLIISWFDQMPVAVLINWNSRAFVVCEAGFVKVAAPSVSHLWRPEVVQTVLMCAETRLEGEQWLCCFVTKNSLILNAQL